MTFQLQKPLLPGMQTVIALPIAISDLSPFVDDHLYLSLNTAQDATMRVPFTYQNRPGIIRQRGAYAGHAE